MLPPFWGLLPTPNPLGTVGSPVKSPTTTMSPRWRGWHREAPRAGGQEVGDRRNQKGGGEIKLGLTPSELPRYRGNTGNGQKLKITPFFAGGDNTRGQERRCVQAGGLSPRTLQAGGGMRQA